MSPVLSYRDLVVWQQAMELETHVLLAQAVELMAEADAEQILAKSERVGKLLRSLIRALQERTEG
jgi:hypothetical protein